MALTTLDCRLPETIHTWPAIRAAQHDTRLARVEQGHELPTEVLTWLIAVVVVGVAAQTYPTNSSLASCFALNERIVIGEMKFCT